VAGTASASTPTATLSAGTYSATVGKVGNTVNGGTLTITVSGAITSGDTINLVVSCDALDWSASTVIATSNSGWVLSGIGTGTTGACGSGTKNMITLTAQTTPTPLASFQVTPVFTVNSSGPASNGTITVSGTYVSSSGSTSIAAVNDAQITNVAFNVGTPVASLGTSAADQALTSVSITPPNSTLFASGGYVCMFLPSNTPAGDLLFNNSALSVTQTSGAAPVAVSGTPVIATAPGTPAPANGSGAYLYFQLGPSSNTSGTGSPTFVISGLYANSGTTAGAVTADLGYASTPAAACTSTNEYNSATLYTVGVSTSPIYGTTPEATAAAEFEKAFYNSGASSPSAACTELNGSVVLATAADPYDALAAAYLEAELGTGVLITPPTSLDPSMLSALRLMGVTKVYPVGGPLALSSTILTQLAATPAYNCGGVTATGSNITVEPSIYGATADATAAAIDNYVAPPSGNIPPITAAYSAASSTTGGGLFNDTTGNSSASGPSSTGKTAIVVSDTDWHDAETAAAFAYSNDVPIVLTTPTALSTIASTELTSLGVNQVIVLGGQLAVAPAVVTSIQALNGGISVLRIAGQDATDTAYQVAKFEGAASGQGLAWKPSSQTVLVAQGKYWSDALAAAPIAGKNQEPILLTEGPTQGLGQYLTAALNAAGGGTLLQNTVLTVQVLGGPLAVPAAQITAMQAALAAG
jgi:putative cell wall-binding protein